MPHDIFISYSRRDLAAVKPIKDELERLGFSCWMDLEGIESGSEEFTEIIARAIGSSTIVLFCLSTSSQDSRWSLNELRLARTEKKRLVIIRFNNDRMAPRFLLEFGGSDVIDWLEATQREKLLRDLGRWCGREALSLHPKTKPPGSMEATKKNLRFFSIGMLVALFLSFLLVVSLVALFVKFAPNTSRRIFSELLQLLRR